MKKQKQVKTLQWTGSTRAGDAHMEKRTHDIRSNKNGLTAAIHY